MKPALIAILTVSLLALAAGAAFADDHAERPELSPEQQIELLYVGICQPKLAEKTFPAEQRKESEKLRQEFLAFLANPGPTVAAFEKSALVDQSVPAGVAEQLGLVMHLAFTCGLTDTLAPIAQERGCVRADGRKVSLAKAYSLCKPLLEKIKQAQEANSQNDTQ